jgi:hypothetical protein
VGDIISTEGEATLALVKKLEMGKPLERTSAGRKAHKFSKQQKKQLQNALANGVPITILPNPTLLQAGTLRNEINKLDVEEEAWEAGRKNN